MFNNLVSYLSDISWRFAAATDSAELLPSLMSTVGIALLTILVPFAIAILSNFLRWESEKREDAFLALDLYVILDKVFVIRNLLSSAALIFLPLLFWDVIPFFRLTVLILWAVGVVWLSMMIYTVYRWRIEHDAQMRFDYLMYLTSPNRLKVVWPSVWIAARIDDTNERKFLTIFSNTISELLDTGKYGEVLFLLDNFSANLERRYELSLFVGKDSFFSAILSWYRQTYESIKQSKEKGIYQRAGEDVLTLEHIDAMLGEMITIITKSAIGRRHSFWYFEELKTHSDEHAKDKEYLRALFTVVTPAVLDKASAVAKSRVWEGFPQSWEITQKRLLDTQLGVSDIIFTKAMVWFTGRVNMKEVDGVGHLERVVHWLFPEIDPSIFLRATILATIEPDLSGSRVAEILRKEWVFGFTSSAFYFEPDEHDKVIKSTLDFILSSKLYEKQMSDKALLNFYRELRSYDDTLSGKEARTRDKLLELVRLISDYKNVRLTLRRQRKK